MGNWLNTYQKVTSQTGKPVTLFIDNAPLRDNPWIEIRGAGRRYRNNGKGGWEIQQISQSSGTWDPVNIVDEEYWNNYINDIDQKRKQTPAQNIFQKAFGIEGKLPEKACGGKVQKGDEGAKVPSALSGRSYLDGFKARNEALWDKVKNNTFVNMVFPVKEVSEGNTEAMLPLVIPGGNAATNAAKLILRGVEKGSAIPKTVTKQAIKEAKNLPISEKIFGRQAAAGRTRPNSASWDIDLLNNYDNGVGIYRTYYTPQRNTRYTPKEIYDDIFGPLPFQHGGRLMRAGGKIIEVPFENNK